MQIVDVIFIGYYLQVQQYKHERECNAIIGQIREDKILRLESLMDGVLPTEEFMEEELASLTHEHKVYVWSLSYISLTFLCIYILPIAYSF